MLKGKHVLLGVTGSIAAYKIANLASMLVKLNADVHVIMTKNAEQFISPVTFETLTGNKVIDDTFERNSGYHVAHIAMAAEADIVMIAPATANVIAKLAHGIADDMLTSTMLACTAPILLSPAMNTHMYDNPVTQENMRKLESLGYQLIEPAAGHLACGDTGKGKMPEPEMLLDCILQEIACEKDMVGKKVLVTAGPTRESLDPVRYITNHSTGKMGYAIAENAARRGAEVTLVSGPTQLKRPRFMKVIDVTTAEEMFQAVNDAFDTQDIILMAAAVADYRPTTVADHKIKKSDGEMNIPLERTTDIIGTLTQRKKQQFICGFSMETQNMLENSRAKLAKKNLDMIVANNLKVAGAGFGTDTNIVTVITKDACEELPIMKKEEVAGALFDRILSQL
ncbi:bifunctional phosphopantothenoylcysteine decarboxylase/phosphopantothenate--cysteine ligase CoaBC [Roseburia sp. MSJ-14]|uniref:bifunctional phosphopantothenoylcysteine decarboxylase/phosphopantothenate--cysteine ligase CoaBC n=1 Tax=Roseburia sp. MSJ-14 TaxID=2841514 RepID=UPI001C1270C0|nr:bifunctional phosphopantothenoylcysteine decarboxylase/phosphopantothenate--cysteine ligase CoaBC [Roseburia sp. MSJ-14]MBU5472472.1 bifunctional phosphopantothenoylcysteine decarboxylase/phosphopantothenate--cysteine ligase CoaBC [Roseburia sp. MSJ-14]